MKWSDLINSEVDILTSDKEKLKKRLDKIRESDNSSDFEKKVSLMAEMKAIDMAIFRMHVLLGKASQPG
jgi:hypothetical protein